jgi:type 1 fimbria pilin
MKNLFISILLATVFFSTASIASEVCLITVNPDLYITKLSCSFDEDGKFEKRHQYHAASQLMKTLINISFVLKNVSVNNVTGNTTYTFTRYFSLNKEEK